MYVVVNFYHNSLFHQKESSGGRFLRYVANFYILLCLYDIEHSIVIHEIINELDI